MTHHFKSRVSQDLLKGKDVTPIPQVLNGERVPQSVWVDTPYPCPVPHVIQQQSDTVPVHGSAFHRQK